MQLLYILLVCIDVFSFILQHKDAYQVILDGVKGGAKEKRLAAQFIPKFFSSFPEMADAAINAQLDLCEDEDVSVSIKHVRGYRSIIVLFLFHHDNPLCVCCLFQIRRQAIKELPRFATGENILRVADILTQLLQTGNGCLQLIMLITFRVLILFFQTGVLFPSVPASVSVIPWESDLLLSLNIMLFS